MPTIFLGRQLALSWPPPSSVTAGEGESRGVGTLEQQGPSSPTRSLGQAPDAFSEAQESANWSPLGCSGAMASSGLAHSIDEEVQDNGIAAEDWLEATRALSFALDIESTT